MFIWKIVYTILNSFFLFLIINFGIAMVQNFRSLKDNKSLNLTPQERQVLNEQQYPLLADSMFKFSIGVACFLALNFYHFFMLVPSLGTLK